MFRDDVGAGLPELVPGVVRLSSLSAVSDESPAEMSPWKVVMSHLMRGSRVTIGTVVGVSGAGVVVAPVEGAVVAVAAGAVARLVLPGDGGEVGSNASVDTVAPGVAFASSSRGTTVNVTFLRRFTALGDLPLMRSRRARCWKDTTSG